MEELREQVQAVLHEYRVWDWRDSMCNKLCAVVEKWMATAAPLDNPPQHKL